MDLVRDLLDAPLVDRDHRRIGRVDDLLIELGENVPPRVVAIERGPIVLGRRLHPRLGRLIAWIATRLGGPGEPHRIPMSKVGEIDVLVKTGVDAKDDPEVLRVENWIDAHLFSARNRR